MRSLLTAALRRWSGPPNKAPAKFILVDDDYELTPGAQIRGFVKNDPLICNGALPGNPDTFDCDDFAFYVKTQMAMRAKTQGITCPLAVGCLIFPTHAMAVCVNPDREVEVCDVHTKGVPSAKGKTNIDDLLSRRFGGNSTFSLLYM